MTCHRIFLCASTALSVQIVMIGAAVAQTAPSPTVVEEFVVTGSRLAPTTFSTPTPVTSVSVEQLQASAPSTLAEGLKQLPSVIPGGGPTAGGGTANGGQNFLNLRGLGASRTLTLLDGHRFISAGPTGQIDTNLLPQGLVSRVDVVTGGASAAYGSDAVSGVINFVLDKKYKGLKADLSLGQSQRNDGREQKASVTFGTDYLGGRGHVIGSAEYYTNEGVNGDAREFRRTASNLVTNPGGALPKLVVANDLRTPYTTGGLVVIGTGGTAANNASFLGTQFGPGGVPLAYSYGSLSSDIGITSGSQNGGDGFRVSTGQEILRPLDRKTLFLRTDFQLTNQINIFAEGSYGETVSVFQSSPTTGTLAIKRDNAFLAQVAPSIVARMTTLGVTGLTLNRETLEAGVSNNTNVNYTARYLGGINGEFKGWKWEASVQQGENRNKNFLDPNLITARMAFAVDAVVNPADRSIVCRATLAGSTFKADAAGCVPFNPFGAGSPSSGALAYVMGRSTFTTITKQTFATASISGDLLSLPAGPISVAAGAEYRREQADTIADARSNAGAYRLVNQQDFHGKYDVKEVFFETQAPLLKDLPLIQRLDLNVAGRHTDYSTSGGVNTWKFGVNWQISDDLRLRATRSRDIRAPNLTDLYATGRQNNITVDDTLTARSYFSVPNRTFGNQKLTPESSDTDVIGLIYRPSWLAGFNLAVDYWNIRIEDAIANVGGNAANNLCNLSNQTSLVCTFITRDASRAIIGTSTQPFNLAAQKTDGVDIEASYKVPLSNWLGDNSGDLTVRALAGYVGQNVTISPLVNVINNAGNLAGGSQPHWRGSYSANYQHGPWAVDLQARYIGEFTWDRTKVLGVDTAFNHVSDRAYLDGQISWAPEFAHGTQRYYVNVQNILDRDPPFAPATGGATPLPTDPNLYDQVGRYFRVGVKLRY
jgi:outer membrane receptor protein involved in Fe transport